MKTPILSLKIFFPVMLIIFLFSSLAQSREKEINFSISTNNIYYSGEEINLNLYSYTYDEKKGNRKADFNITLLRIKDINAFYSRQTSRYGIDVLSKDSMNLLYLTEEVYSLDKTLRSKDDYNYWYINESIPLSTKTKGAYLVKVTSGNKVAYCGFIVSDLGIVSKAGNNSMLAYVVDRKSGNPISNTDLNFYLGTNKIGQGKTADGIFYQSVTEEVKTAKDEDMIPMIIGKYNDDIVISDSYLFFGYAGNKYYTYIFTEQPVYRTSSEVNFKGTIRKNVSNKFEPVANKELTVIIKDSKGAEVYKEVTNTNDMGSFAGTYKIEEEGALGIYTIFANIDENNSYSANF
ncbi:MAG: MG2 domain-containing protein, partial [Ignavibacteria bacterium]